MTFLVTATRGLEVCSRRFVNLEEAREYADACELRGWTPTMTLSVTVATEAEWIELAKKHLEANA